MENISYELDAGFLVSLAALRQGLERMSRTTHQWAVVTVPEIFLLRDGEPRSYVLVGYSNPGASGLPNFLCFMLPLVALGGCTKTEPLLIVSLSSRSMLPLTKGLYFESGDLKYDEMEDWARVWYPLKQELWPDESELKPLAKDVNWFEISNLHDTISATAENLYREELVAFITALSKSEEVILDAVQGQ